ncbi:murein hydrolase activator EnvC family protein [Fictibacillus iocasae]|uniref:Murein hydrolase activator EnvC family protein n=1 Tax=Fictibacillus iocasae TaxID=2715437 RepID=A0ABW2NY82_9BACL
MNRRIAGITLSISLALGTLAFYQEPVSTVKAETLSEIKKKQQANKQRGAAAEKKLAQNEHKQEALEAEIERLDKISTETDEKIRAKESEIADTKEQIAELEKEIAVVQKRIDERDKMLKDRVKAMYENGGAVNYLDVVLGSKDFGNFIERVFALNMIAEQDKQILEEQKKDKELLESKKSQIEAALTKLQIAASQLQELRKQLDAQMAAKDKLMGQLEKEHSHLEHEIHKVENADKILASQEAAIRAEMERAARASMNNNNSGGESSPPPTGNGMIIKPASGALTSGYANRFDGMHYGVDIAQGGTVPIHAAADGTVIRSEYSNSYGNVIYISHYINGQTWTTVYAHMRSRAVQGGSVKRGQMIGYMGNTGQSMGQHLHFELHKGPWNQAKSNAVNPAAYW